MKTFSKSLFILITVWVLLSECKNIDGVSPASRITFIKVFEKYDNYEAQVAEQTSAGFVIGSNLSFSLGSDSYVTLTDTKGAITKEQRFPLSTITTIKVIPNNAGYLVYGDVIHLNPSASNINDQVVTKARILKLGPDLSIVDSASFYTKEMKQPIFTAPESQSTETATTSRRERKRFLTELLFFRLS